ncbi:unnamed protein product [Notodromas monacha]|uniref:non-specific serine/threonine protein kinase n=1 Tax=Notodromas monacha TaxID=399045 RepID=A0A7R9BLW3_9CRUS|nr:unnamed protein product [Notodromas monacha]CAG0916811.1 unnamed protein product [Notodromas monacha]
MEVFGTENGESEEFPGQLLHQAALWDNDELVRDLLQGEFRGHVNAPDSWGRTALHAAAVNVDSRALRVLLEAGGNPNIHCGPRGEFRTPLHIASEHGHRANVEILLKFGADFLLRDGNGLTAYDLAEQGGHHDCLAKLRIAAATVESRKKEVHEKLRAAAEAKDVASVKSLLCEVTGKLETVEIVNAAPNGTNTLLFKACEDGCKELVKILLESGADCRSHPVTKYSPLYISCYYGRKEIVEILLQRFPQLIQSTTVEKWTPLHACCINGHSGILDMLLRHKYPEDLSRVFVKRLPGEKRTVAYRLAFDVNARDVSGQTILYQACVLGNQKLVDTILKFKAPTVNSEETVQQNIEEIKAPKRKDSAALVGVKPWNSGEDVDGTSPTRKRISDGIQALISRLHIGKTNNGGLKNESDWISPVNLDEYCNSGTETCLHVAVKARNSGIAAALLAAGADPNARLHLAEEDRRSSSEEGLIFTGSNALVEACRFRDIGMIDLLLKHGARDDDCKAFFVAAAGKDEIVMAKLLALKSHADPDYKINRRGMITGPGVLAPYSSVMPTTAVMINWHNQRGMKYLKDNWLVEASLALNPRLKLNAFTNVAFSLAALTRLDISSNGLTSLPDVVFQLPSLKLLNASQNKISCLPSTISILTERPQTRSSRLWRDSGATPVVPGTLKEYCLPVLEELLLSFNQLDSVPEAVFKLPSLVLLDISNNKISELPFAMWTAPRLRDLNASWNLLSDVPSTPKKAEMKSGGGPKRSRSVENIFAAPEFRLSKEIVIDDLPGDLAQEETDSLSEAELGFLVFRDAGNVKTLPLMHHSLWRTRVEILDEPVWESVDMAGKVSQITNLNLSHNEFHRLPLGLACLAVSLQRLNLSFNGLTDVGPSFAYPASIRQLDLAQNRIHEWMSNQTDFDYVGCYASPEFQKPAKGKGKGNVGVCAHKMHRRLENLRTLVLSDNYLSKIVVASDDSDSVSSGDMEIIHPFEDSPMDVSLIAVRAVGMKSRLLFPNLTMLDVSNNRLHSIPPSIQDWTGLSVLNISGNSDITELPPEMGLLNRLWNLNCRGCGLQDPLRSMIDSRKYRTLDIIGYLRSILEDARPYARMKLMVVGVQGIGKTTLLECLRSESGSMSSLGHPFGTKMRKPDHWGRRMGHRGMTTMKTNRGTTLSTVGVDIADWVYEKREKAPKGGVAPPSFGPVAFRTWDFGGQQEYYATHQYFLSRRSLYLVAWRITDGEVGVRDLHQWLINIQARAPNSPVIIVGTHADLIQEAFPPSYSEHLQSLIRTRFIGLVDADKVGLPRVVDSLQISCKTKQNVRLLCNLIYDTAFSLRSSASSSGSGTSSSTGGSSGAIGGAQLGRPRLLEQKIPATYLALEDVIGVIAAERRKGGEDPVLTTREYRSLVTKQMKSRFGMAFRDGAELNQATAFLHENGVLLHYDDSTLKDLYFLDPQWLCDMLAHVVTIREINPFAKNGLMKLNDLAHLFRSSQAALGTNPQRYIVSLLNKFELGLTWDTRTLLIPSLLPSEVQIRAGIPGCEVRIPVRSRAWAIKRSNVEKKSVENEDDSCSPHLPPAVIIAKEEKPGTSALLLSHQSDNERIMRRLVLVSYFPSGFWSRLTARMLGDDSVMQIIRGYFDAPHEVLQDSNFSSVLDSPGEWVCWQTGIELKYASTTLFLMREILPTMGYTPCNYRDYKFEIKQEDGWEELDISERCILEILLPNESVVIRRPASESPDHTAESGMNIQSAVLDPNPACATKLLALAVDHIDTLLEDWYPTLGTRFVHTSEGKFLVTRIIPCPKCVNEQIARDADEAPLLPSVGLDWLQLRLRSASPRALPRLSQDSIRSGDSGVGQDSDHSTSRVPSLEGNSRQASELGIQVEVPRQLPIYCVTVEECILRGYSEKSVSCLRHGELALSLLAPDTVFMDLGDKYLIRPEALKRDKLLGRGAFGFVFAATCSYQIPTSLSMMLSSSTSNADCSTLPVSSTTNSTTSLGMLGHRKLTTRYLDVALKMLEPVDPGSTSRQSAQSAYKAASSKWSRDPLQYACKAYCTARQELRVLSALRHPHIVALVGVSPSPLALVLELATLGALDDRLKDFKRSGDVLDTNTVCQTAVQVARALEYLHQQRIIYRDLKSENVLVWEFPRPFQRLDRHTAVTDSSSSVRIKLGDYGISRASLPTGTKGFGGTEGYMAPEILQFNGEEEYTEKVDCFSFAMFLYELITLKQPFEGSDSVKESILEGGRPPVTHRSTTQYPAYILDLMAACWSHQASKRPSASQIVSIATAPEFTHMVDVVSLETQKTVMSAALVAHSDCLKYGAGKEQVDEAKQWASLWISRCGCAVDVLSFANEKNGGPGFVDYVGLTDVGDAITAIEAVDDLIWCGDLRGTLHVYCATRCTHVFDYTLEPDAPEPSPVRCMVHIQTLHRVGVALGNGRLFLCRSDVRPSSPTRGEGLFIMTELAGGPSGTLFSLSSRILSETEAQLWCGQGRGMVSVFTLRSGMVTSQETLEHSNPLIDQVDVLHIVTHSYAPETATNDFVWTYVYPGCIVYQWDTRTNSISGQLDCSKLAPCSESLKSIAIDEHLSPGRCQVTSMAVINSELYIGTTWGCLIVANAESMRPVTVFRPFEEDLCVIKPMKFSSAIVEVSSEDKAVPEETKQPQSVIATVGKGYRSLIPRYTGVPVASTETAYKRDIYAILWRVDDWLPDFY